MMQQIMTPYQHNSAMQMYTQQLMCQQRIQQQQMMQLTTPDIAPMEAGGLPPQLYLSRLPVQSRMMDYSQLSRVNNSDPYCCYFLEQLQGSYEVDGAEKHLLQVELSCTSNQQCLIVHGSLNKQCVSDLYIYEEDTRFTLCSADLTVIAVMLKGMSMKECVTWYAIDGTRVVWRRAGKVAFSLVEKTPNTSRRNSIASVCSAISSVGTSGSSMMSSDVDGHIRPELKHSGRHSTEVKFNSSPSSAYSSLRSAPISQETEDTSEEDLLNVFHSHFRKHPSLLQRFLNWGILRIPNCRVGDAEATNFGKGRVWVSASLMQCEKQDGKNWSDVLDELKGAYEEASPGVYLQSPPQENEPGVRHRLKRNSLGLWTIEEYVAEQEQWVMCAQELPYGGWVDSKDNLKMYNIRIVPMVNILSRMKDDWSDAEEMEKNLEFLFKSCNHKKLNTKLKARNLRHNIANLKVKLEKQHKLCFGVTVANVADEIAFGIRRCTEEI